MIFKNQTQRTWRKKAPAGFVENPNTCLVSGVKVKVTLEQATKAQRGEQMYRSALPLTSALDGGGWSTPRPGRFTPGKDPAPIV